MTATSILTIISASFIIALIAFFSRPWLLMLFILIFVYLLPRAGFFLSTEWYSYPLPIGYILIVFIMVRWVFLLFLKKTGANKKNPLSNIFSIVVVINMLAIVVGFINGGYFPIMAIEITFYFIAFFIFFMILDMFSRRECINIFIRGILVCGMLVSLYGVLLLLYGKTLLVNYVTYNSSNYGPLIGQFIIAKRTISSYGDPNTLSAQLMVFCSIFASLLFLGNYNLPKKIFLSVSLILSILCIYFASSRASLIGLFVLLIVMASTKIKKLWAYIPILISGYFVFIEPIRKYYEHRIYTAGITSDLRITYIGKFFDLLTRYPFGVGFGNTVTEDLKIVPAYSIWSGFNSFYLHIFSRIGIQGLIIFTLTLVYIVKYLFQAYKNIENPTVRNFVFGGTCGLIVQQFNFMTNNVYHVPGGMLNFWIMCGMLVALANVYKKPL